jgi:hypothetical protein
MAYGCSSASAGGILPERSSCPRCLNKSTRSRVQNVTASDDRRFFNATLRVLRVGCSWRDMHERCGKRKRTMSDIGNRRRSRLGRSAANSQSLRRTKLRSPTATDNQPGDPALSGSRVPTLRERFTALLLQTRSDPCAAPSSALPTGTVWDTAKARFG